MENEDLNQDQSSAEGYQLPEGFQQQAEPNPALSNKSDFSSEESADPDTFPKSSEEILKKLKESNQALNQFDQKLNQFIHVSQNRADQKTALIPEKEFSQLSQLIQDLNQEFTNLNLLQNLENIFDNLHSNQRNISKISHKLEQLIQNKDIEMGLEDLFGHQKGQQKILFELTQGIKRVEKEIQDSAHNQNFQNLFSQLFYNQQGLQEIISKLELIHFDFQKQHQEGFQKDQEEKQEKIQHSLLQMSQQLNVLNDQLPNLVSSPEFNHVIKSLLGTFEGIEQKIITNLQLKLEKTEEKQEKRLNALEAKLDQVISLLEKPEKKAAPAEVPAAGQVDQMEFLSEFEKKLKTLEQIQVEKPGNTLVQMEALVKRIERLDFQLLNASEKDLMANILKSLQRNSEYLSEVKSNVELIIDHRLESSPDSVLEGMQKNNLYLAKVEQKMDLLIQQIEQLIVSLGKTS